MNNILKIMIISLFFIIIIIYKIKEQPTQKNTIKDNIDLNNNIKPEIYIKNQLHPAGLVHSIENENHFALYDQALAIIVFSHNKDFHLAQKVILSLEKLQHYNGSFCFTFSFNSEFECKNLQKINGAIAWVSIALSDYKKYSKDNQFEKINKNILKYLSTQEITINQELIGIKFSDDDNINTSWNENHIISTEHNIDYYSALYKNQDKKHETIKKSLIKNFWNKTHFFAGINYQKNILDATKYLDTQAWGFLSLGETVKDGVEYNCQNLMTNQEDKLGFVDQKSNHFIWYEGTLSQLLAIKYSKSNCQNNDLIENINTTYNYDKNGIIYSSQNGNIDFPSKLSIASSSWLYFFKNNLNPFL